MPANKISHNSGMAQLPLAIFGKPFTTMKKALFHGRLRVFGEKMNTSVYRLSHAALYISGDGSQLKPPAALSGCRRFPVPVLLFFDRKRFNEPRGRF